jgi:hypothetical protein
LEAVTHWFEYDAASYRRRIRNRYWGIALAMAVYFAGVYAILHATPVSAFMSFILAEPLLWPLLVVFAALAIVWAFCPVGALFFVLLGAMSGQGMARNVVGLRDGTLFGEIVVSEPTQVRLGHRWRMRKALHLTIDDTGWAYGVVERFVARDVRAVRVRRMTVLIDGEITAARGEVRLLSDAATFGDEVTRSKLSLLRIYSAADEAKVLALCEQPAGAYVPTQADWDEVRARRAA